MALFSLPWVGQQVDNCDGFCYLSHIERLAQPSIDWGSQRNTVRLRDILEMVV